jgi:hypothetical protein
MIVAAETINRRGAGAAGSASAAMPIATANAIGRRATSEDGRDLLSPRVAGSNRVAGNRRGTGRQTATNARIRRGNHQQGMRIERPVCAALEPSGEADAVHPMAPGRGGHRGRFGEVRVTDTAIGHRSHVATAFAQVDRGRATPSSVASRLRASIS